MKRGSWELKIEIDSVDEISETTLEHIAKCIKEGYTSGEVIEESDDE